MDGTLTFTVTVTELPCRRCGRLIPPVEPRIVRTQAPKGRRKLFASNGDTLFVISAYHLKCLPPKLFHQLAGSLPVGQFPPTAVPQQ